ncbi:hypothetical protein Nepgr_021866 [Nepenthes gracilis]|uniref:Uncharacterized protein n=1 Tax=Nepenthes gracilis TaxID=150966 RepID=A0AAD3XXL6_NEPGR|nr:hypothetical protein Nepgr_021866 [Nepenthes gracilis]
MTTSSSSSSSSSSSTTSALSALGNLIKLLPTGTVFLFEFLSPVLSNNGKCHTVNKILTAILIGVCGLSCVISCFTDSYTDKHGKTHYGIVTTSGLWTSGSDSSSSKDKKEEEGSKYKLRFSDFVHAGISVLVFAVVVILDAHTVDCFFPSLESSEHTLVSVLPVVIGAVSSAVLMVFPSSRHGIGYPSTSSSSSESSSAV